jgi:endopeptidase La
MSDSKKIKRKVKLKPTDINIDTNHNDIINTTNTTTTTTINIEENQNLSIQLQIQDISPTSTPMPSPSSCKSQSIALNQFNIYSDKIHFIEKKKKFFETVIQKTVIHLQNQRQHDIINIEEYDKCINNLYKTNAKLKPLFICNDNIHENIENTINLLQIINNDISSILREHGTKSLEDLIKICWGGNNLILQNSEDLDKYDLLKEYFHPINYKIKLFSQILKPTQTPQINPDGTINTNTINIQCYDIDNNLYPNNKTFYMKVFGIQFEIINNYKKIIISGYLDNVVLDLLNNTYINNKKDDIIKNVPKSKEFKKQPFYNFIESLSLKDYLIYNNTEIYNKYIGYNSQYNLIKQQTITTLIQDFLKHDLYTKRIILIQLLIKTTTDNNNILNLASMLYDILSIDLPMKTNAIEKMCSKEQFQLYESFPRSIQRFLTDAMTIAVKNINSLLKFDINKIPLEQQIFLMNVNDTIKEKAMVKLREIKSKTDDSASKARQYLEGLLKIPFGIYKKEPIFEVIYKIKEQYIALLNQNTPEAIHQDHHNINIIEIGKNIREWKSKVGIGITKHISHESNNPDSLYYNTKNYYMMSLENINQTNIQKKHYERCIDKIMKFIKFNILFKELESYKNIVDNLKLSVKKITKLLLKDEVIEFIRELLDYDENKLINGSEYNSKKSINKFVSEIFDELGLHDTILHDTTIDETKQSNNNDDIKHKEYVVAQCEAIEHKFNEISNYFIDVKKTLDESIYGHENAKKQIERIIGQWINGSNEGYCFGFEGSPGIGKTSMAKKGLANCLKDNNGVSRPFSMIQIGGDSNGSTLHGHNYTYLGSTWGSIVQILMDKKCMNPIIFIDEIDKISKTEHGRELTNILTHLLDPAQNDCFQDKYFNGIDLDLSKALFIVSYNDPEAIDRVLLDRIHRIKFDNLYLKDKIVIAKNYLLPEIYKKMGLENMIEIHDDVLVYIIKHYTNESGVRKLKEKLFDIISEINLIILKSTNTTISTTTSIPLPYQVTLDDIKTKYFKDVIEINHLKIQNDSHVGYINGLWANVYGNGGILPIQCNYYPTNSFFNLKLTGMQGDVMKESMSVAQTLAWELTDQKIQKEIIKKYNDSASGIYGIHIHCPEGATPKDGPSAGGAITTVIYSLLNTKKIKNDIAMTGEITLHGKITAIGGLSSKIIGAIHAGVKEILFPLENEKDFDLFIEKQISQFSCELIEESNNTNTTKLTKTKIKTKKYSILERDITFYMVENINQVFDIVFCV